MPQFSESASVVSAEQSQELCSEVLSAEKTGGTRNLTHGELANGSAVADPVPAQLRFPSSNTNVASATPRKRRGKCMSRRRGQEGSIETSGSWIVVRFWIDVPGQDKRQHACRRICPKSGAGLLSKSAQIRRAKEIIAASGADTEEHFRKVVLQEKAVVTFGPQAEWWLNWLRTRNNNPIPDSSVPSIRSAFNKWLIPNLGDMPLSEVGNGTLKILVKKMVGKLAPKSINTYVNIAKEIRESLVDDDGEPVYPVKWNNDFIDLPRVVKRLQRRGKLLTEQIEQLIANAFTEWVYALYVLDPATGIRIDELLAIEIEKHISPNGSMILVTQQMRGGRIVPYLKTEAAYRVVDLCPEAADFLRRFIGDRKGFLFPSQKGTTPISYGNFLKRHLTPDLVKLGLKEPGKATHAYRRFRASVLSKARVEEDLRKFWLGHENHDITAEYAEQIHDDNEWRQAEAARVGLGFKIPPFVPKPIVRNVRRKQTNNEAAVVS
jgi:integrase